MKRFNYCLPFGAGKTQNIIITPADITHEGDIMVTAQFCDFVAVWFAAKKINEDLVGEQQQLGAGTIEENEKQIIGVCTFLKKLGYKTAAAPVKEIIKTL